MDAVGEVNKVYNINATNSIPLHRTTEGADVEDFAQFSSCGEAFPELKSVTCSF